jgi:alcohol dehydrogenase (cytochrome c)
MCAAVAIIALLVTAVTAYAQGQDAGRSLYTTHCARCHGGDGNGGELGPAIVDRIAARTDSDISTLVHDGRPDRGMPPLTLSEPDMRALTAFLRTLRSSRMAAPSRTRVKIADGTTVDGIVMNRTAVDLQLLSDDNRLHLLRLAEDGTYRRVTSQVDWPMYHGMAGGNRYSAIDQINTGTVARLAPTWMYNVGGTSQLQVTPVVVGGIMYVTTVNECDALDAGTGRRIWQFKRTRTKGLVGDAASGINRGAAVAGDRLFLVTDNAHIVSLDRFTGALLWESEMADSNEHYGATSAPLAVGHLVVSGVSGGDEGIRRGFVAAFDQMSGKEAWRFWTVPAADDPAAKTWQGTDINHGCAATWLTGTYDASLNLLYWPTGNPCPDYDGTQREGDNLYSDSILALDPATGALKWHFQYTPHDLWDWDAQQPPVLVDAPWEGQPRHLLLHANRNGFFYVLDRTNGALLLAKPFVKKLTWARAIGADGRPVLNSAQEPTAEGVKVCPAVEGATNWFSTSFSPSTGFYYVQALEKCTIYTRTPSQWTPGKSYYSGATKTATDETPQKVLRAIDIKTGAIRWELPQTGPANSWGGTLATAGGLVFFGEDSGAFAAVDAATGRALWRFQTNSTWKASPMTYVFDGRQYIAVASGSSIVAFALVEQR